MDKKALQYYAVWAKNNLESQIEVSLKTLGINSEHDIKEARKVGDYTIIDGDSNSYPGDLKDKRDSIVKLVKTDGYKQVIEEFAYTWFNRIVALRFMEVHDFLPHGFRVLSSRDGGVEPEIMKHLDLVKDELKLDLSVVQPLYSQGKLDEAYSYVLFRQCYALSRILPMLFDKDQDYLELLLPKALLKGETFITKLMEIGENIFLDDVEVIGWLYQFYISQKKDDVFASKKTITKDTLPAVTQLFTPDWIVRYMAENSVGRIWLESYPNTPLKKEMRYYVEDAKQEADVQSKLDSIRYKNVNPEEIRVIEPCCGSGHILVYIFDLLYKMYEERGYQTRDIPTLILKNNIVGLDVDKRASQLASFSLVMKARSKNSRFFASTYYIEPKVYEIWDSRELLHNDYEQQLKDLVFLSNAEIKDIKWLVEEFRYAKTIGSLLRIEKKNLNSIENSLNKIKEKAVINIFNSRFLNDGVNVLRRLLQQAKIISSKYDVMITNPPYISISTMEQSVKDYASKQYANSKSDMFAMFMETDFVKDNGFVAMINMHGWMFIDSFLDLRKKLLSDVTFISLVHHGIKAFEFIGNDVVQTCSFVYKKCKAPNYKTAYIRLVDVKDYEKKQIEFFNEKYRYNTNSMYFLNAPTVPFAYWVEEAFFKNYIDGNSLEDYGDLTGSKNITGNNDKYLRQFWEVESFKINKDYWVPYAKGGFFRKYYGNITYVVDWRTKARNFYLENKTSNLLNRDYWFKEGITYSAVTSRGTGFRYFPKDCLFDYGGPVINIRKEYINHFLGFLNSKVASYYFSVINPSVNLQTKDLRSVPYLIDETGEVERLVTEQIKLAKEDWATQETSFEYKGNILVNTFKLFDVKNLEGAFKKYSSCVSASLNTFKENEIKISSIFQKLYRINDIDIPFERRDFSIKDCDVKSEIVDLISYFVGVSMGRYSLDVEGLAYAGGEWNPMNYVTYQPDDDGIIPVYTQLGMADGLTSRIIKLIKHIYGEDTYRENIEFIAEALGKNQNESAEETLNRYLNYGFYADHLKTYQKRPIYWMFSSGKNDAFKCLVYLHRYNEDTLAKINSKYFLNESARLNVEVNETRTLLEAADGREKLRLDKQMKLLNARQKEMIEYGQVLDHMANQYIHLDLDDGVKVNYAKFQGIEIVNDNGTKVKKDLLVPIK